MNEPLLVFAGSPANRCEASESHNPTPLRHVWHHIQPKEAGGQTVSANLVQLCDSCHYTVHRLMWIMAQLAQGEVISDQQQAAFLKPPRKAQLQLAATGYDACRVAGTIPKIPNEG
jgi:HNH endonuclease